MRVARAFRFPMIAAMATLALSGCTHTSGPVATVQPQGDLDSLAYGPPPRVSVAYATAPMPVAYDVAYRLDAGDKLRVMVYGQEGLTNTYAVGAGGTITMPLIGSVPARGRTPGAPRREQRGENQDHEAKRPHAANPDWFVKHQPD